MDFMNLFVRAQKGLIEMFLQCFEKELYGCSRSESMIFKYIYLNI